MLRHTTRSAANGTENTTKPGSITTTSDGEPIAGAILKRTLKGTESSRKSGSKLILNIVPSLRQIAALTKGTQAAHSPSDDGKASKRPTTTSACGAAYKDLKSR
jgi:hypothetical protein